LPGFPKRNLSPRFPNLVFGHFPPGSARSVPLSYFLFLPIETCIIDPHDPTPVSLFSHLQPPYFFCYRVEERTLFFFSPSVAAAGFSTPCADYDLNLPTLMLGGLLFSSPQTDRYFYFLFLSLDRRSVMPEFPSVLLPLLSRMKKRLILILNR